MVGGAAAVLGVVTVQEASELEERVELLGFQSIIHPDGNDAEIILRTTAGRIDLLASLKQIGDIHREAESAAIIMQCRQSIKNDAGVSAFDDLLRTAVRPTETLCIIEPGTGDRLFVMHFADRLPIVIRMSPEQVAASLEDLSNVSRQTAN